MVSSSAGIVVVSSRQGTVPFSFSNSIWKRRDINIPCMQSRQLKFLSRFLMSSVFGHQRFNTAAQQFYRKSSNEKGIQGGTAHSCFHSPVLQGTSTCSDETEKGRTFKSYLSGRHVFKWYVSICQLAGCYPYAVNVRLCIVTLEILKGKENKNCGLAMWTGNAHDSPCGRINPND